MLYMFLNTAAKKPFEFLQFALALSPVDSMLGLFS